MEDNYRSETSSGKSSATASSPISNTTSEKNRAWTNEKHDLYLDCLEASFVSQFHQVKCLVAPCSEQTKNGRSSPQKLPSNVARASEQEVNLENYQPVPHFAADFNDKSRSACLQNLRCEDKYQPIQSSDVQEYCKLDGEKSYPERKRKLPHGLMGRSMERLETRTFHHSSVSNTTEGSDQNFVDEVCEENLSMSCGLKAALAKSPTGDQIAASRKFRRTDSSTISTFALEGKQAKECFG